MTTIAQFKFETSVVVRGVTIRAQVDLSVREFGSTTPHKDLQIDGWRVEVRQDHWLSKWDFEVLDPHSGDDIADAIEKQVQSKRQEILMEATRI